MPPTFKKKKKKKKIYIYICYLKEDLYNNGTRTVYIWTPFHHHPLTPYFGYFGLLDLQHMLRGCLHFFEQSKNMCVTVCQLINSLVIFYCNWTNWLKGCININLIIFSFNILLWRLLCISTSVWSVQHPNAGQNIQQMAPWVIFYAFWKVHFCAKTNFLKTMSIWMKKW